jgi:hypothetical protein
MEGKVLTAGSSSVPIAVLEPEHDFVHRVGFVFTTPGVFQISAHCQVERPHFTSRSAGASASNASPNVTLLRRGAPPESPGRTSLGQQEDIPVFSGMSEPTAVLDWFQPSQTIHVL